MSQARFVFAVTVFALVVAAGCARPSSSPEPGRKMPGPVMPALEAGALSLYDLTSLWRDQRGETVPLSSLAGKVQVIALAYTHCRASCPLIVADLKRIEASLPVSRRNELGFVLVSLDPRRDTPGRLAEWAASTGLNEAHWTLLNGDDEAVRELAAVLGVRYQEQADGEIAHTNALTVLDRDGAMVHHQTGLGDPSGETAAAIAQLLFLREAQR